MATSKSADASTKLSVDRYIDLVPQGLGYVTEKLCGWVYWNNAVSICFKTNSARVFKSGEYNYTSEPALKQLAKQAQAKDFFLPGQLDLRKFISEFGNYLSIKRSKGTARLYARIPRKNAKYLFLLVGTFHWTNKIPVSPVDLETPWFIPVNKTLQDLVLETSIHQLTDGQYSSQLDEEKVEELSVENFQLYQKIKTAIIKVINEALVRTYGSSKVQKFYQSALSEKDASPYVRYEVANETHFLSNLIDRVVHTHDGSELNFVFNLLDHSNRIHVERDLKVYEDEDFKNSAYTVAKTFLPFDRLATKFKEYLPGTIPEADLNSIASYLSVIEEVAIATHLDLFAEHNMACKGEGEFVEFFNSFMPVTQISSMAELNRDVTTEANPLHLQPQAKSEVHESDWETEEVTA